MKFSYTEYKHDRDKELAIIVDVITLIMVIPLLIWAIIF